jgi:peptidoglycan/xylan/chitin deacetylase (PgdA/CDA1 family)
MNNKINIMTGILYLASLLIWSTGCNSTPGNIKSDTLSIHKIDTVNKFAWKPVVYDSTKQYIYLTFDDGPQRGTNAVLELIKQLNVKATFFMVGLHTTFKSDGMQLVNMIKENYPQTLLANHSYSHANDHYKYFYQHPLLAEEDFFHDQQMLHVPFKIIRLPGNSAWAEKNEIKATSLVRPITELLDSAGYSVVGWDVEWSFNHKTANPVQTPEKMAAIVDSALAKNYTHSRNHIVILSHDRMFRSPNYSDSLSKFISLLKQNPHYVFETIDHYPGMKLK